MFIKLSTKEKRILAWVPTDEKENGKSIEEKLRHNGGRKMRLVYLKAKLVE